MVIYLNESLFKKKEKVKKKYQALTKKEGNEIFNYIKQILHKFPLFEKECNLKDYGKSKDNQNYSFSGEVDDDQYLILFSYPNKKSIPQDGDFYDYIFNKINNTNTKPEPPDIKFYIIAKSETDKAYIVALSRKNIESTNEAFGLSKKEKESKKSLRELELEYDRKFNAFFLRAGAYSVDKLELSLENKEKELKELQSELKHASRQDKYALKIKEDYLKNICNKCKELIKKKKQIEK